MTLHRLRIPELTPTDFKAMEARAAEQRAHAAAVRERTEMKFLLDAGVHATHLVLDDSLVPSVVRAWIDSGNPMLRDYGSGGLILCGPVGTGKSATSAYCAREMFRCGHWDDEDWPVAWRGARTVRVVSAVDVIQEALRGPLHGFSQALLVIEDWKPSYPGSLARGVDALEGVVDTRWGSEQRTIVTTNARPADFQRNFPASFSRLTDTRGPGVVVMGGSDRRNQNGGK